MGIRESKEFKSSVDKMMQKANNSMMVGSSSWLDQFTDAFTVQAEDDDDEEGEEGEEGEEKMPSCGDYIMHFLTLPWKLIFAFIPPTGIYDGYPTFAISILFIGACTAVIGDIAGHLGCFINLKDGVNAIASVTIFCIEALLAILILMLRRSPVVGGELGGPKLFKTISSSIFVFFWCFYVAISALEAYGVIKPGF